MNNDLEVSKMDKLQQISDGSISLSEKETNSMKQKLKIFLIAQAEAELNKVINYTKILDKIETTYQLRLQDYITQTDDTDKQVMITLSYAIETITRSLDRSQKMIEKITGNSDLFNLVFVDNSVNKNVGIDNSVLLNTQSRIKIREAVERVLASVKEEETFQTQVTEVENNETCN